jgi:hypothetical protein
MQGSNHVSVYKAMTMYVALGALTETLGIL